MITVIFFSFDTLSGVDWLFQIEFQDLFYGCPSVICCTESMLRFNLVMYSNIHIYIFYRHKLILTTVAPAYKRQLCMRTNVVLTVGVSCYWRVNQMRQTPEYSVCIEKLSANDRGLPITVIARDRYHCKPITLGVFVIQTWYCNCSPTNG